MALSRRSKRWLTLVGLLVVALLVLKLGRNRLVASALRSVVLVAEKAGHQVTFGRVDVSVIGGHIRITDLDVLPLADTTLEDSTVRYTVHADVIELDRVDLWALVRHKVLRVGRVELNAPSVLHSFVVRTDIPRKDGTSTRPETGPDPLQLLRVDTLRLTHATGRSQNRAENRPALQVADLDLLLTNISVDMDGTGKPIPGVDRVEIAVRQAEVQVKPYYTLSLDSLRISLPEEDGVIFGLHFVPDVDPKKYHERVDTQVELYNASVDTILLSGFDLVAKLNTGALRAKRLYVAGASVDIHRDKSIPITAKKKIKPLTADLIASWNLPVSLDSIVIERGSVTYHERLKRADEYGSMSFTGITGTLTGVCNEPSLHPADLRLVGTAKVGRARAELDVYMPMASERTTVTAHVVLRDFPAKAMNRMTSDLLHVNATSGIIHLVDMHMYGDDDRATGTLDMRYENLTLELGPQIEHAKLLSKIANTVVRGSNMPGEKGYRVGRFEVMRLKDSGLFKYIWISLRDGMKEVVLPKIILDQLKAHERKKQVGQ